MICPSCEKTGLPEPEDDDERWNCETCGSFMYRPDEVEVVIRLTIAPDGGLVVARPRKIEQHELNLDARCITPLL